MLLESSSETGNTLSQFRSQNADVEAELFSRIQNLENKLSYGLPPQLNPGEYENLVRENLENVINVRHYHEALSREFFELKILEMKSELQENLFNLIISERRIDRILELSLNHDIRRQAFEFIEDKVEPVSSMRHAFERNIFEGTLRHFVRDIEQNGTRSFIYREFFSHFTDEEFRRLRDP